MIRIELEDGQPRYCYHVAGQDLVSDREIEALAAFAASDEPLPTEPADPEPATPLTEAPILFAGRAWVGGATRWVECRSADGAYRLTIAGEPILRIEPSGVIRRGQGRPGQGEPSEELLVGPALILALASRGVFCLHASAVQVGGGVLLLPGDSGRGKSTLAATWSSAEGKSIRLADDVAALRAADHVLLPAFPQWKLATAVQRPLADAAPVPVIGVAELGEPTSAVAVVPRKKRDASLTIVRHTVAAKLFDAATSGRLLDFATTLAARRPVWQLSYPHSMDVIPDVIQELEAAVT